MKRVRGGAFAALSLCLTACPDAPRNEPTPGAEGSTSAIPAASQAPYPAPDWGALRDDTERHEADGITTVSRTLMGRFTPTERIGLAIRFEASRDPQLDWSATLADARFVLSEPGGTERTLSLSAKPKHDDRGPLQKRVHVLNMGAGDLKQFAGSTPWKTPDPHLFAKLGRYRVRLEGELVLGENRVPFKTGSHEVEVVDISRTVIPVGNQKTIAARFVAKVEGLSTIPKLRGPAIADVDHNAIFRFRIDGGYVDIAMSPRGGMRGAVRVTDEPATDPWRGLFTRAEIN